MKSLDGIVPPVASCGMGLSGVSVKESFTKPLLCQLSYAGFLWQENKNSEAAILLRLRNDCQ